MGQGESVLKKDWKCAACEHVNPIETRQCLSCKAGIPPRKTALSSMLMPFPKSSMMSKTSFIGKKSTESISSSPKAMPKMSSLHRIRTHACLKDENYALIFLKPNVPKTDIVRHRFEEHFNSFNCHLTSEGSLTAEEISELGVIDAHYFSLASNAMDENPPKQPMNYPAQVAEKFQATFGVPYSNPETVLTLGQFLKKAPTVSAEALDQAWEQAEKVKIGGGYYVGRLLALESDESICPEVRPLLLVNGFYAMMRRAYVTPPNTVLFFTVEWKESDLSWKDFRYRVIGSTDPTKAHPGSLRGRMMTFWKELGLEQEPSITNNCVHASAGPIEAMRERATWIRIPLKEDPFVHVLLQAGVSMEFIEKCVKNEPVAAGGKTLTPAFDLFEDVDSSTVIEWAVQASRLGDEEEEVVMVVEEE